MKPFNLSVSNINRIDNEYHWIHLCISVIREQNYKSYETTFVDNKSNEINGR